VCSDLYLEIAMNMKNHEKKSENSVSFHARSSKDSIQKKRSENVLNITGKKNRFTICVMAISYNAHACSLYVIPRG